MLLYVLMSYYIVVNINFISMEDPVKYLSKKIDSRLKKLISSLRKTVNKTVNKTVVLSRLKASDSKSRDTSNLCTELIDWERVGTDPNLLIDEVLKKIYVYISNTDGCSIKLGNIYTIGHKLTVANKENSNSDIIVSLIVMANSYVHNHEFDIFIHNMDVFKYSIKGIEGERLILDMCMRIEVSYIRMNI